MARQRYEPSDDTRRQVGLMAGYGLTHDQIAATLGISDETLRKYYRDELRLGVARANAAVAKSLFERATKDKNVIACLFWLKCRGGWRETEILQVEDKRSIKQMSTAELQAIVARGAPHARESNGRGRKTASTGQPRSRG